jgi:hypothetical protein
MTWRGRLNMWERLGGLAAIIVAVTILCLISYFEPPTFVQIICALGGSIVCLFGVVFLFAQDRILTKNRTLKKSPRVG